MHHISLLIWTWHLVTVKKAAAVPEEEESWVLLLYSI